MNTHASIDFRRSRFCSNGGCLEVGFAQEGEVLVRDGKRPSVPHNTFSRKAWAAFLEAIRAGEFDR
jgi:hypothetical protein